MDIAIVGGGVAGLTAGYLLARGHDISLYEAEPRLGGHTATIPVERGGERHSIDTGFIVFNDRTYPHFIRLLAELGVDSQPSEMSFSVSDGGSFEYSGSTLATLFAQRRNLVRPGFWRMLRDILRFNRESVRDLDEGRIDPAMTLGEYLARGHYSAEFRDWYLIPMGGAIWSSGQRGMQAFPVRFFVRFFRNHGLLSIDDRPQWRTVRGGSHAYLGPLSAPFAQGIRRDDPVTRVARGAEGVTVTTRSGHTAVHDQVVMACHSDQALRLLAAPTAAETAVLGAIPYRENDVVLHTDTRLLPQRQRAWASWNYRLNGNDAELPVLTYNMNILQRLQSRHTFCVTLNDSDGIDPRAVIGRYRYSHPVFTVEGVRAQERWDEVNGRCRTWFCGAWWANGFHEDAVASAVRVARALGVDW